MRNSYNTNMNRKTSFQIYTIFWVIVVAALMLATIYQSTALNRDIARIPGSLRTKLPSTILIGCIAQVILTRIVHSMKKTLALLETGKLEKETAVLTIYAGIKKIGLLYIIVNSIGFFAGPAITFIVYYFIGRHYPPAEMFFIFATHLLLGALISVLQLSLLQITMFKTLDSFSINRLIPDLRTGPVVRKRRLTVLAMLSLFTTLAAGQLYGILISAAAGNLDPQQEMLKLLLEFILHGAVFTLIFMFVFYVLSQEEQNKLSQLQRSIEANLSSESGDLSLINIIAHDDYGVLASAINGYTSRLARLVDSISAAGKTVGATSRELQNSVSSSAKSLETLQKLNMEINSEIESEHRAMGSVSQATVKLSDSITIVENEVENQAALVEQSSAAVSEISANIQSVSQLSRKALQVTESLNETVDGGSTRLQETVVSINNLNEASSRVQNIIKVIQAISSQTNLLAMNAAIEAAHAGEAGAGFSVVADEVRKLAEESSRSANEIRIIIGEMTNAINSGVSATEKTNDAFTQITASVEGTSQIINTVTAAMEEQNTAAAEITTAMSSLVDVSESLKQQVRTQIEHNGIMNTTFTDLSASILRLEQQSKLQKNEDEKLANVIETLSSVSNKNSEAVEVLAEAVNSAG